MSTPVTTPVITQQPDAGPARPRFTSRKSVGSAATCILTLAISIGAGVMLRSHDTEKAMKDFAADVRDEPGIKSVRELRDHFAGQHRPGRRRDRPRRRRGGLRRRVLGVS
jgi:hypothetical protein